MPVPVKLTTDVGELLHITSLPGWLTVGDGLTVMVNVKAGPGHVTPPDVYCGVTVTVATTGAAPLLTAVNEAIAPVPLPANPIDVVLFAQL